MSSNLQVYPNVAALIESEQAGRTTQGPRILVVTSGVKGLAILGERFAEVAAQQGVSVSAVVSPPALVKKRALRPARFGVSLIDQARHRRRWRRPSFDQTALASVIGQFDGVLVAGTGPAFPIVAITSTSDVRCCVMIDVTMHRHAEQNSWRRNLLFRSEVNHEAMCLRGADRVISISEWARSSAINDLGVSPEQIVVTPPVLDASQQPSVPQADAAGPIVQLAAVGSPWVRKGMDLTVDWVRRHPEAPVMLHLFGDSPGEIDDPRIVEHGRISSDVLVADWLPKMDLLVHPTRRDQSSTVAVEAAWAGVPCLITAMAGIPDLIDDGVTGWLMPEPAASSLDARLSELVNNPAGLAAAGRAARAKAEADFNAAVAYAPFVNWLAGFEDASTQ